MKAQLEIHDRQLRIEIYQFTRYDMDADKMVVSKRWGTKDKIKEIYGNPIETSKKIVDATAVDSDISGLTEPGYNPPD